MCSAVSSCHAKPRGLAPHGCQGPAAALRLVLPLVPRKLLVLLASRQLEAFRFSYGNFEDKRGNLVQRETKV